ALRLGRSQGRPGRRRDPGDDERGSEGTRDPHGTTRCPHDMNDSQTGHAIVKEGCTLAGPDRICSGTRTPPRGRGGAASLRLVAEMRPGDALLQVLERAKVVDDVPARVVEEDLAVLVAADGDQPLEVVPVLEEIVDGLRHAAPGDDRDLGPRGALR